MRRQVSLLVAVISTALVASFVIPLLLLVRTLAEDRGVAVANQQANTVAVLVSGLHDDPRLAELLEPTLAGSPAQTSVVLTTGEVVGAPWPSPEADAGYQQAKTGAAFSVRDAGGATVFVPVLVEGGVAVTRAQMTSDQLAEGVPLAWASIIALGLLLTGIAVLVAAQAGRRVSQPLLEVANTAHRLREGELAARAPLAGTPETVELGAALNGLADRIGQLLAAERENVRGLAHRLRTPVTALRLEAENVTDPTARADLGQLVGELQVAIDDVVREARRPLREDLPSRCEAVSWCRPGSTTGHRWPKTRTATWRSPSPQSRCGSRSAPSSSGTWSTSASTTFSPTRRKAPGSAFGCSSSPARRFSWSATTARASHRQGSNAPVHRGRASTSCAASSGRPTAASRPRRSALRAPPSGSPCRWPNRSEETESS